MSRTFLIMGLLLALTACATRPVTDELTESSWEMSGKLVLQSELESRVLSLRWSQDGDRSEISLSGPLGVTVAHIQADRREVVVDTGDQVQHYQLDDEVAEPGGETLRLPWRRLAYWIRGWQDGSQTPVGESGVEDGRWSFRILKRDASGPQLMVLEHPEVRLRLKVKAWRAGA